jgi:signal transduction histidine kinase
MYVEAQHLQRLVEDLRTLSMADAGELPLNRQPTAPEDLLRRLKATYLHAAGQAGIALEVQADPNLPDLDIDPDRMAQVLGNLVSNALRYTPEGGRIVLAAHARNGAVTLLVRDTGHGISPEALPRVFDRFYRGDTARQQQAGESGLGLAIARSIVEAHGGTIAAESELGRGTVFVIELPVWSE